jgi:hypothetical protein
VKPPFVDYFFINSLVTDKWKGTSTTKGNEYTFWNSICTTYSIKAHTNQINVVYCLSFSKKYQNKNPQNNFFTQELRINTFTTSERSKAIHLKGHQKNRTNSVKNIFSHTIANKWGSSSMVILIISQQGFSKERNAKGNSK